VACISGAILLIDLSEGIRVAGSLPLEIGTAIGESEQLFLSLAEQMKMPLMQIARQAEAGDLLGNATETLRDVRTHADIALRLIDGYMLSMRLAREQHYMLEVEPVAVSSILYDAAHQLYPIAKSYGVELEVITAGKYGPVAAHQQGIKTALVSLGYALIEALPATNAPQLRLELAAHRCRYGIATGIYADNNLLTTEALRYGQNLRGTARQPLPQLSHTGGAGVFVADVILQALGQRLRVSHYRKRAGLGTVLTPNPQLQLI
jgi:hypothetical protein